MEKVRPGTGREAGLGHAGGRAPTVGALGDAGAVTEEQGDEATYNYLIYKGRLHRFARNDVIETIIHCTAKGV